MWVLCRNWEPLTDPASSSQLFDGEWRVSWGGLCQLYFSSKQTHSFSTTLPRLLTLHPPGHSHRLMVTFHLLCLRADDAATCKWTSRFRLYLIGIACIFFDPREYQGWKCTVGWHRKHSYTDNDFSLLPHRRWLIMLLKDYSPFFFVSQSVISLVTHLDPHSNLRIWKVPSKKT